MGRTIKVEKFEDRGYCLAADMRLTLKGRLGWFALGGWDANMEGRIVCGGPEVRGPYMFVNRMATVIDNHGGTGAEMARARAAGNLAEVEIGDVVEALGRRWEIRPDHNDNLKLVDVGAAE